MPEKKNQHFVPRFYLKKFSLQSQKDKIGLFHISSFKFISSANLYEQASRSYFYGRDLKIENTLGNLESESSKIIHSIIDKQSPPQVNSREHQMLLMFIITLLARTVYAAEKIDEVIKKYKKTVLSMEDPHIVLSKSEQYADLNLTNTVQKSLITLVSYFPLVRDLCLKLLINRTQKPFITSDHPVVLYNQFLEHRKRDGSNVGIASKGLQIFLPLSPKFTLILFDKDVYKVGFKNEACINVNSITDIESLNLLQFINANKNIYFNEAFSEKQVKQLLRIANPYRRKSKVNWDKYPNNEQRKILLHLYSSDIKCSLKLSFVSLVKKAKSYIVGRKVSHVRNEKIFHFHQKFRELVDKGLYDSCDFYEFIATKFFS